MSGNILLCGDFNARTASEPDFIVNDDNSYSPTYNYRGPTYNPTVRQSDNPTNAIFLWKLTL
jgi:hypothetical protein